VFWKCVSGVVGAWNLASRECHYPLNGPACQTEVWGYREHVAGVGPHTAFSDVEHRREMQGAGGTYEDLREPIPPAQRSCTAKLR